MRLVNQTVRWGIKSVGGLLANLALLTVWVDLVGVPAELAAVINWVLISIIGYVVTDRWVFRESASPMGVVENIKRYAGMQSVMLVSKGLNYVIYLALFWTGVDYRVAWVVGAGIVFVVSFAGNRWLWHSSPIPQRG
jgi:putative flippase GtrA